MLKPTKMTKIDIQVPQDHIAKATICIANLKILHLLNVRKIPLGQIDLESQQDIVLRNKYKQLKHQLENLSQALGFELAPPTDPYLKNLDPYRDIITLEKDLQEKDADIKAILTKIKGQEEIKREKQELLLLMKMIFNLGIDLSQFHQSKFLYCAVGLMPAENIERLEFSLSTIYHILLPSSSLGKRRLAFILASKKDEEKIEKALNSAFFKKLDLSVLKEGLDEVRCQDIQREIQDITIDMNVTEDYLKKLKKPAERKLRELYKKIYLSLMILDAARSFNKVGDNYQISGWIPQEIIPTLEKELREACPKEALITVASLDSDKNETKKNGNKIPTFLKNPFFLKPFERLVFGYDIPDYYEVEPTFFFAISFLLMFGVMFGDVGHGLVLFLGGFFAFKRIRGEVAAQIGVIAMECGFMSTIFGFLYGSLFGFEHVLPALWFHPMGNIYYFMKVTVGFGMVIISLGLLLNIINSIKNKEFLTGIFSEFGLMGLIFYWGCASLAIIYMLTGKFVLHNGYLLLLLFSPLLVIFFKEPLYNLYNRVVLKKNVPIVPSHLGIYLLESFIEVGDTIIGFLSNTVSFIRVAAFALAHAGLFLAVFALARTMQNIRGGLLWYWIVVILGNIGIIVVEGLVVSIQTIRLEYYEFFSKFFKGGGELYKPLKNGGNQ